MVNFFLTLLVAVSLVLPSSAAWLYDSDSDAFYHVDDVVEEAASAARVLSVDNLVVNQLTLAAEDSSGSLGDYASNVAYVSGGATPFGNGYLYLPKSAKDSFGISQGYLVNTSAGSITGTFVTDTGNSYSVSFATLSTGRARYQYSVNNIQTIDFNLRPDFSDTNMTLTDTNASPFANLTELLLFILVLIVGVKQFA